MLGTALLLVVVGGQAAEAATPLRCGSTISGSVTLTANLTCTTTAFKLAGPTTLNLAGHTITGPGTKTGVAAFYGYYADLSLSNGTVTRWAVLKEGDLEPDDPDGPYASSGNVTLNKMTLTSVKDVSLWVGSLTVTSSHLTNIGLIEAGCSDITITGSQLYSAPIYTDRYPCEDQDQPVTIVSSVLTRAQTALSADRGVSVVVSKSTITHSVTGIDTKDYSDLTLTQTTLSYNSTAVTTGHGWDWYTIDDPVVDGDQITANTFTGNHTGLSLGEGAVVADNSFTKNTTALTFWDTSNEMDSVPDRAIIRHNTVTRNGDGLLAYGPAQLSLNTATNNTGYGIYAPSATDLGGNIAYGNGTNPQCTGVVCATH
jgi:hypothetical protein